MTVESKRKPILKKRPSGKFKRQWFQEEDLARLVELDQSANWSEMGAMKTTTVEWLMAEKLKGFANPRVLIITTKTGKGTYFESLHEVLPEWDVFTVDTKGAKLVIGPRPAPVRVQLPNPLYFRPVVVVAHYHCFTNKACLPEQVKGENGLPIYDAETGLFEMTDPPCMHLLTNHWDFVVLDEAHKIKNRDNQWTVNIKKIKAQYRHVMTGTGFVNNPAEIWSLLNFLYPKVYTGYDKFKYRYCNIDTWSGYEKIVGINPAHEDEFKEIVRKVGVRRTMIECFPDIEKPIETIVPVELNKTQRQMYDQMLTQLRLLDQKGEPLHSPTVLSMLQRLRQIAVATPEVTGDYFDIKLERRVFEVRLVEPSSKLDAAMELIEGLEWDDERRDQIVVYSDFKDPLKLLEARLAKKKIPYLRLLTEMNEQTRYQLWHDTWPKKEHQVFLSTLSLGAESINLASANRAIFLDQAWSPVPNNQARGRIYRPGQKGVAQFIYIRADNTVDARVLEANETKTGWFKQIFGAEAAEDEDEAQT
jgi:hypothetical protein